MQNPITVSRWKAKFLKTELWEDQECPSQGCSKRKEFEEKVQYLQMLERYQSELNTLDLARSLEFFKSKIKYKRKIIELRKTTVKKD